MVKIKKQSSKTWKNFIYDTLRELPDANFELPPEPEEREVLITKQIIKDMAADMNYGLPRTGNGLSKGLKSIADKYGITVKHVKRFSEILQDIVAELNQGS